MAEAKDDGYDEGALKAIFLAYCRFGEAKETKLMTSAKFMKVMKEAKVVSKKVKVGDIDTAFAKVKNQGKRKIGFKNFKRGIEEIAKKKYPTKDDKVARVANLIIEHGGPNSSGTRAQANELHDNKNNYTGVYKQGMSVVDEPGVTMEKHLDRSDADARGVRGGAAAAKKKRRRPQGGAEEKKRAPANNLREVFDSYIQIGDHKATKMDSAKFFKLCKEKKLIKRSITRGTIDVIFAKYKGTDRKIDFNGFKSAVAELAGKVWPRAENAVEKAHKLIMANGGAIISGTTADEVALHDDRSNYTGVYKQGMSTVDSDKITDISQTLDRTAADARGVNLNRQS